VALRIDPDTGLLIQSTPAFGGELVADIQTPHRRPQMATVHPGIFQELPHDHGAIGRIMVPDVKIQSDKRIRLVSRRPEKDKRSHLKDAQRVIAGGRGVGSKEGFQSLHELAALLDGEVGATRPAIRSGWVGEEQLIGQTGKSIKPKLLITIGTSGALQYTTGIEGAENIIAINRDPHAPIFRMADLGLVGDATAIVQLLLSELRKRM
jgi:electron transfer flavoprotein alpha subunit